MQAQYTQMSLAEELVKGYEEGTLSSEDALRKLNALGYKTGINTDNALERLEELIPEIREYATSEREAYIALILRHLLICSLSRMRQAVQKSHLTLPSLGLLIKFCII